MYGALAREKLLKRLGCCQYPYVHSKSCIVMASYHSPFTKSPIQSLYPSGPVYKCYCKLAHQAQDTRIAQRCIATPPVPSTTHPPITRASPCPASHALALPQSWGLPRRCHHHYHPRHRHCHRGLHQQGTARESIQPMGWRQRAAGGSEGAGMHRGAMENGLGSEHRPCLERKG